MASTRPMQSVSLDHMTQFYLTRMRRARISIKPNVRPGGRSVAPAAEDKSSQGSTAVGDTQQTHSPSTGDGNVPGSPSEKASLNMVQKNMAVAGEEDDDDDNDEELLVPKVRVAEDGSLILDEERCASKP
ncbi:hypothetical protein cypCar_00017565 [Cyprinus carpio]|nr:hypothetical protein cypCar_00017565 [Cyprinus carpio]